MESVGKSQLGFKTSWRAFPENALNSCFVGCATRHCHRSFVILGIYQRPPKQHHLSNQAICRWLLALHPCHQQWGYQHLAKWFETPWKLARNLVDELQPKQVLHHDHRQENPPSHQYNFYNHVLESVPSQKYLGVHISNTLSWNTHIQEIVKKAQRVQNVIRRNLWSCHKDVKATAYLSLVRPILEYASSAWDPSTKQNIKSLERVQRQAARFCTGNYHRDTGTVTYLLKDLGWDTLQSRRTQQKLCMLYKMKHGLVDIPLYNYVQLNTRDTRGNNQKFIQVSHKARAFQDSFFVSTVKIWNSLSGPVVNSATLAKFKEQINSGNFQ